MPSPASVYRFASFELRTRTRELYKNGIKLKLRPQPLSILEILLERRGDLVTREELHQLLWKSETFVDFEQGLNTAVKELRSALSDSADAPRYVETVPRLGYRIIVPVVVETFTALPATAGQPNLPSQSQPAKPTSEPSSLPAASTFPPPPAAEQAESLRSSSGFHWRWVPTVAMAATVIVLVGIAAYWRASRKRVASRPPGQRIMLAVLPFDNLTGDASQEYFSDGLTEEMISQLGRIDPQRMGVIARTSVMHYKQNPTPLDRVGHELGVDYVIEGSVRRDANTVRVSAQLIQVKDQTHLWSRQYDRQLSSLLDVQQEIAQEVADEIQLTLGVKRDSATPSRPVAAPPSSYETYDLYLKGLFYWNKRSDTGLRQAAQYFQQAIDKDPNYARAYAGLADTFALLGTWNYVLEKDVIPKARAAALKALQIDDNLAEAHASLALIAEQYDYDWPTAEKEFRRAIQLDPDYATGHQWYAECLAFEGRFDEAFAESERARQIDPLSVIIATDDAVILYYSRQYDRSIEQFQAVHDMQPGFPRSGILSTVYVAAGKFADALADVEEVANQHKIDNAELLANEVYIYGRWGRRAEAQRAFAKFQEAIKKHQLDQRAQSWMPLYAYVGIGRNDDAIAMLQKEDARHMNALIAIKVDPFFDPLRSNPRFQGLLARAHFTP